MVSVDQVPDRVFLVNTLSALYLLLKGRTALRINFCVVFLSVLIAVATLMPHLSLRLSGETSECLLELWNVLMSGISDAPAWIASSLCNDNEFGVVSVLGEMIGSFLVITRNDDILRLNDSRLNMMKSSSGSGSPRNVEMPLRYLLPPTSSSNVVLQEGNFTFVGSHAWADDNYICGHISNSRFVGVCVSTYTMVPAMLNCMLNSLSGVIIDSGDVDIGLSCTFTP